MAQRSHVRVPKFGDWDSNDNIPYTACFENARRDRADGTRTIINPNDPEENPEAFMFGLQSSSNPLQLKPLISMEAGAGAAAAEREKAFKEKKMMSHQRRRVSTDHQQKLSTTTTNTTTSTPESGSEKSNSNRSLLRSSNHHGRTSSQQKKKREGSNSSSSSFFSPSRGFNKLTGGGGSNQSSNLGHKSSASVPKFGAWDERDPKSGEGFTVIFNKVKEEKQTAASKFPAPPQNSTNDSKGNLRNITGSKVCCCLSPSVNE